MHPSRSPRLSWRNARATAPLVRCAAALAVALGTGPAAAIVLGQTDSFSSGLDGWVSGAAHPAPPVVVTGGGPGGAADSWLQITATGAAGPGGKLVGIAGGQWTGDYTAAGVTGIALWMQNPGNTDLSLRLWLNGTAGAAVSLAPVVLAAHSGWQAASFSLKAADLSGPAAAVLSDVLELRLFHGTAASFPGPNIAATLGIDHVSAVPEPGAAALLLAGLGVLAGAALLRAQRAGSPPPHRHHPRHAAATRASAPAPVRLGPSTKE